MPRAIVYRRVSDEDQVESGAGLAAQIDACRAWAGRNGYDLAGGPDGEGFADEAVGGATEIDRCPGLVDALAELRKGDVLLVAKRDRLGRDPILVATIEALVERKKARVVSAAGEGTAGDDPADVLMRHMIDAFAVYERLLIKARTRAALAAKTRRGERTGRVPFGKRLVDDGRRSTSSNAPVALADDEMERAVLGVIRNLRMGGHTFQWIARALNRTGGDYLCRGKPWQSSSIAYLCNAHGFTKGTPDAIEGAAAPAAAAPDPVRPAP